MSTTTPLERLAERVGEEGAPLVVSGSVDDSAGASALGELAAAGPRTGARGDEYALIVESIREGYLCHYGTSRVLEQPDDDLALLAGDLFYAIGIRGLAELEDLESTGILSDLIRVAAELQASGRPDQAETLWMGQIVALACGKDEVQERAVKALELDEEGASDRLEAWSTRAASTNGIGREFDIAQTAIDSRPSNF